jgi:hypothetical protein
LPDRDGFEGFVALTDGHTLAESHPFHTSNAEKARIRPAGRYAESRMSQHESARLAAYSFTVERRVTLWLEPLVSSEEVRWILCFLCLQTADVLVRNELYPYHHGHIGSGTGHRCSHNPHSQYSVLRPKAKGGKAFGGSVSYMMVWFLIPRAIQRTACLFEPPSQIQQTHLSTV